MEPVTLDRPSMAGLASHSLPGKVTRTDHRTMRQPPSLSAKPRKVHPMSDQIQIAKIAAETIAVPIIGTAPLIVHNFSDKSKRQMLDAQQGRKTPKVSRDPDAEYQAAFYRTKDGYGFPVTAFKAATIGAARFYGKDVSMTSLRQFLFMHGQISDNDPQQLVDIYGEPRMREDVVRLGGPSRSADLRYRPEFPEWSTILTITYVKSSLSRDSVLSLVDAGGMGLGVGEWRPEKRGEFGTYKIDTTKDIEVLG